MKNPLYIFLVLILLLLTTTITAQSKKILFVLSAADTLELNNGKKLRQTGVFLNEFYLPYKAVSDAGFSVDFATPNAVVATIDNESKDDKYWKNNSEIKTEALLFVEKDSAFNNPFSLEKIIENLQDYDGMIVPGGQGLMVDLINEKNVSKLLKYFAENNKPIGLVCHAPSLILSIPKKENPFVGYEINSVSPLEEWFIESFIMKGKPEKRKIAKQLKQMGLIYKSKSPKSNFAVRDRNLVSSQNPYSSEAFNKLYLEALLEYSQSYPIKN
ncbi:DJ-1/PfpI family protein [Yeosuana marina]|uniref:DJ-1/PfpI family protein n=1 Tax=Yeosuana marina TaxID=1565536 RepID=UPI0014202066|nr:DJ-1/PfpI family protein [Yeosuana marina]